MNIVLPEMSKAVPDINNIIPAKNNLVVEIIDKKELVKSNLALVGDTAFPDSLQAYIISVGESIVEYQTGDRIFLQKNSVLHELPITSNGRKVVVVDYNCVKAKLIENK